MRQRTTRAGLAVVEGRNSRKERMRAWRTMHDPMAKLLEKELKELDPRIEVDFIDPEAAKVPLDERAPGLVPARWHVIVKTDPGLDDHYFPIVGPNMSYRDPELKIVDEMKAKDLWKPKIFDSLVNAWEKEAVALRRQEITEGEARIETVAAAFRAAKRVKGDRGEHARHDRKGRNEEGVRQYAGGVSQGGVVLPPGVKA